MKHKNDYSTIVYEIDPTEYVEIAQGKAGYKHNWAFKKEHGVVRLDLHGNALATYDSRAAAGKSLGIHPQLIGRAIRHETIAHGFYWVTKAEFLDLGADYIQKKFDAKRPSRKSKYHKLYK